MKHQPLDLFVLAALAALLPGLLPSAAKAQMGYDWTHFAGLPGTSETGDGTGAGARFTGPQGVAVDGAGNVYVADTDNHTIRKVTPGGVVTTLAGSAGQWGSADGTGSDARFGSPTGVAVDGAGNVYVADRWNNAIRKVTPGGVVTTFAGGQWGSEDGIGSAAGFDWPEGVAVDGDGNVYVADTGNHTIRKVTSGGVVTTLAGTAGQSGSADGTGSAASFAHPRGVAVDGDGNVYVADTDNHTIRKVTPGGVVTTLAGSAWQWGGSADGTGSAARFGSPTGVAVDGDGNVYVADTENHAIRKVTSGGVVTTLAGTAWQEGSADGTGAAAKFYRPRGVAVDGAGNVYVADTFNNTIRKVTPGGAVTTLAGAAVQSGSADGTDSAARFDWPTGVAVDGDGNVYVADTANSTIRKVTPDGVTTTLAGSAWQWGDADGTGSAARFSHPRGVAVDGEGNVYVADMDNHAIRKVTPDGVVTTLAGGRWEGSEDGTGAAAMFDSPTGVAVDGDGNVYVADMDNHTIRKVTPGGVVTTLVGTAGQSGSADGTGAAARFRWPQGVAVDGDGNVYVADTGNHTIRKVTPAGVVTTLAGSDWQSGSANGTGAAARFSWPQGVAVDGSGNVYVADSNNSTIRKVTPGGVVTTIGGTAGILGNMDGTGAAARFLDPWGVAAGSDGSLFVADAGNHRVIKGNGTSGVVPPTVTTSAASAVTSSSATVGGDVTSGGGATVTERGVVHSTAPNPAIGSGTKVAADSGTGSFTANLTGLSPATTHYVRAYAINSAGTAYGPEVSFVTQTPVVVPPTVTTSAASSITTNSATAGGSVTASGGAAVTERGVVRSTAPNPTIETGIKVASGSGVGSFTTNLTGLSHDTTYYVRAYAVNSAGTAYGTEVSFATQAITPTPVSNGGTLTGLSGAVGASSYYVFTVPAGQVVLTIQLFGGAGNCDLYVRRGAFPTLDEWDWSSTGSGNDEMVQIANPEAGSYYVMLRAHGAYSGVALFGGHAEIVPVPPTVTTGTIGGITTNSATAGGNVTSGGGVPVTERGVVRSTAPNPTVETGTKVAASVGGTGSFAVGLAGLNPGTTYYVRAYAINSAGTAYGPEVSFVTQTPVVVPPTVTTGTASGVTTNSATVGGNVTSGGGTVVTERGTVCSTVPNPTVETGTRAMSGSGTGSFTAGLVGLSPGTTYYVRAYAINSAGTAYGPEVSFQTVALPLGTALNSAGWSWNTGGGASWSTQTSVTQDGSSAAVSGAIGDGGQSWMQTTVTGPGTLTFWWKVSSEAGSDLFRFLLSGVERFSIDGEVDWQQRTVAIPAGVSTLRWVYAKDGSGSGGSDRAWLAQVRLSSAPALTVVQRPRPFPATVVGRTSRTQTLRVANGGGSALAGLRVAAKGSARKDFVFKQPARKTLKPGAATTFKATFRPKAKGVRRAKLTVSSSARPVTAALSGRGKARKVRAPR